jgi:tetratricopeptide (TPR) repeat protein
MAKRDRELHNELVKLARAGIDRALDSPAHQFIVLFQLIGNLRPRFRSLDADSKIRCIKDVIGQAIERLPDDADVPVGPYSLMHAAKILYSFEDIDADLDRQLEDSGISRPYDRRVAVLRRKCVGVSESTFERQVTRRVREELARALIQLKPEPALPQEYMFVKRPTIEQWYQELSAQNKCVVGLYGEPGTGKTWLARHLSRDSGRVIFLNAQSRDSLLRDAYHSLPALAFRGGYGHVGSAFSRWLAETTAPPGTVIIDNASDWEIVSLIVPPQPDRKLRTNYIITSNRIIVPSSIGVSLEVGDMEAGEAMEMVKIRLPSLNDSDAGDLTSAVEGRPLAIEHACALLEAYNDYSVADLIAEIETDIVDFFDAAPAERKLSALYRALLRKIEEDESLPLAWQLLKVYAFLGPEATMDVVDAVWAATHTPTRSPGRRHFRPRPQVPRAAFDTAVRELAQFSLLQRNSDSIHPYLMMHQLTYGLIHGLRSRVDESMPHVVLDVALAQIQKDEWFGGLPVSHRLRHWLNPIAQNIVFIEDQSINGEESVTAQLLILHAYMLSTLRNEGQMDPGDLEHYVGLHRSACSVNVTDTTTIAARKSLAGELVASGILHSKSLDHTYRGQIIRDAPQSHIYDSSLGDFFYPAMQHSYMSNRALDISQVEHEIAQSRDDVMSARWYMLAGALHYDKADWSAANDAYDKCFQLAVRSGTLSGYVVAFEVANRAVELRIREGLCHDVNEPWLRRIEVLQTDEVWLRLDAPEVVSGPRLLRTYADLRLATIFANMSSLENDEKTAELERLTEEYVSLSTDCLKYSLSTLRGPALYQLGRVYVYRGMLDEAREAFSGARNYIERITYPSDFGVALCDLALLKLRLRVLPKGRDRITRTRNAVAIATKAGEMFIERYGARYWQCDALLTVWTFMKVLDGYNQGQITKLESLARHACEAIERPDRFHLINAITRENLNPVLLFTD